MALDRTRRGERHPPLRPFRASFARLESQPGRAHFRCLPPLHLNLALEKVREIILYLFIFLFHVKRFVRVNKAISLTYTKFAEDHVQHILDVDPAEQSAEGASRHPQILRRQFLTFLNRRQTAL
jgi:hypothetical protein